MHYIEYCALDRKTFYIKLGESVTHGLSHKEMIAILSYVQGIYNKYLVVSLKSMFMEETFNKESDTMTLSKIIKMISI